MTYQATLARVRARLQQKKRPKSAPNKKLATVGTVKRLINFNVDKVRLDTAVYSAQTISTAVVITQLSPASITDLLSMDDYQCRYKITNPTLNVFIRIIFFQWKDTTTPVTSDVLSTSDPLSPIGRSSDTKRTCGGKIHVLRDMLIHMNTTDKNVKSGFIKFYKKKLLDLTYDGSEIKNKLYVLLLSDAAATPPVITMTDSQVYHEV